MHHKLSQENKQRHFSHELGLLNTEAKGGVTAAYKKGYDAVDFSIERDREEEKKLSVGLTMKQIVEARRLNN